MGEDDDLISGPWLGNQVTARRIEKSSLKTADLRIIANCDDGCDYAVKDGSDVADIPHAEWFCTRLGEMVGLASPPCKIVNVNGELCFGSRWETGNSAKDWWLRAEAGQLDFSSLIDTLSRIYAFDLFVHNVDRHLNNYIIRDQHFGPAMLAFDYSMAWTTNGFPLPELPMDAEIKTVRVTRILKAMFGDYISAPAASYVLDKLRLVSVEQITVIIEDHPKEWLTEERKNAIVDWWSSTKRLERIHGIEKGISDGSYL